MAAFDKVTLFLKRNTNNTLFKFGLPFFVLVVGGSFGLKQFTSLRYEYSKKAVLRPEEAKALNSLKKAEEVTLESEYEKIKEMDIDNWVNIRGPRPWEEPQQQQSQNKKS